MKRKKQSLICGKTFLIEDEIEGFLSPITVKVTKHIAKSKKSKTYLRIFGTKVTRGIMNTDVYQEFSYWAMINWNVGTGAIFYKEARPEYQPAWFGMSPPSSWDSIMRAGSHIRDGVKTLMMESTILESKHEQVSKERISGSPT